MLSLWWRGNSAVITQRKTAFQVGAEEVPDNNTWLHLAAQKAMKWLYEKSEERLENIRQINQTLHLRTHKQTHTVSIQQEIEVKHKVLFSVRQWAQCTCYDLQTNRRVKLGLLCMSVFVCVLGHVQACLQEVGEKYIKRERPYQTVPKYFDPLPPFKLGNNSTTNTNRLTTLTCRWQRKKFLRKVKKRWDVVFFLPSSVSIKGALF